MFSTRRLHVTSEFCFYYIDMSVSMENIKDLIKRTWVAIIFDNSFDKKKNVFLIIKLFLQGLSRQMGD